MKFNLRRASAPALPFEPGPGGPPSPSDYVNVTYQVETLVVTIREVPEIGKFRWTIKDGEDLIDCGYADTLQRVIDGIELVLPR